MALAQGDLELAATSLTESIQLSLATGQRLPVARGLDALAVLAVAQGDPARAVRLEGAAMALREAAGAASGPPASARTGAMFGAAREQLGAPAAAALLAEGAAMGRDEAVRYGTGAAIATPPGGAPDGTAPGGAPDGTAPGGAPAGTAPGGAPDGIAPGSAPDGTAPGGAASSAGRLPRSAGARSVLTVREHEIAILAARGRSNKAIADELVISPLTVARHVANIFAKLGFRSRSQLAGWLADEEPGAGS